MKARHRTRALCVALTALLTCGLLAGCSDDTSAEPSTDDLPDGHVMQTDGAQPSVSFARDISPILQQRCVICHRQGGVIAPYFDDPFGAGHSIINYENSWATVHDSPYEVVVKPGDPDNSFLVYKLEADPDPETFDEANNGSPMPRHIERLTAQELANVRQWIADGAQDDAFFADAVAPIFGTEITLGRRSGKCTFCHYQGSPTGLTILDVFDDQRGLVNAPSLLSSKLRVAPGSPDQSFLIEKLEQDAPSAGERMPLHYPRFSDEELTTLRQWIAEGALDN
jgi:hypothetical protein